MTKINNPTILKEAIVHADLIDMPDVGGSNTDHDGRYVTLDQSSQQSIINAVPKLVSLSNGVVKIDFGDGSVITANVVESEITLADNTTNNTSGARHGFAPKLSTNASQYLDGGGSWSTPTGTSDNDFSSTAFTAQTSVNVVHNFGAYPLVQVIETGGTVEIPYTITHNTVNDFTVTFNVATTGTIIASMGSPQPMAYKVVTDNYTVLVTDRLIECSAADKTITMFTAVSNAGHEIIVDNSSSGDVTVACYGAETIEDEITQVIPSNSAMNIFSNGTNWRIY